ncbi:hypothetical protein FQN60_010648, partial [Etheostoma spectabile]
MPLSDSTSTEFKLFTNQAIPSRATGTEATIEVVFDSTTPIADLPENNVVAEVLVTAVSNPNNTFDVSIDPGSVKVAGKRSSSNTAPTTAAPTTAAPTTAAPTTTVSTTAVSTTAELSTAVSTTTVSTTAV